ncbi:hypothetical protein DFH08DRAFT_814580 [Mycena albidolilacea]|uniref:Uncharacterized protein n=1 Tax=Mycena albidolilacea TaxID=1033008 RepID=A0AAD6ZQY3_9AGAR|nr:hypothetical protein DFH08DRAFT_814580 [Mycena albidolilacea]
MSLLLSFPSVTHPIPLTPLLYLSHSCSTILSRFKQPLAVSSKDLRRNLILHKIHSSFKQPLAVHLLTFMFTTPSLLMHYFIQLHGTITALPQFSTNCSPRPNAIIPASNKRIDAVCELMVVYQVSAAEAVIWHSQGKGQSCLPQTATDIQDFLDDVRENLQSKISTNNTN